MKFITKESLSKQKPHAQFSPDFDLSRQVNPVVTGKGDNKQVTFEFVGTSDFPQAWFERQTYEVNAGLEEEPLLYESIYLTQFNPNFQLANIINYNGVAGVVFHEHVEGGEVKFMNVSAGQITVSLKKIAALLEYTEELATFNQTWSIPEIERQVGIAHNAKLNDIHLSPIINFSYTAANQTAADTTGTTYEARLMNTLTQAIQSSVADGRKGRYVLLTSGTDAINWQRVLTPVPQQGYNLQPSGILDRIEAVIAYDGWQGIDGLKEVEYAGVPTGTSYLIDVSPSRKRLYARSMMRDRLTRASGNADISRFIAAQVRWHTYVGTYIAPDQIVEEITMPVTPTP